MSKGHEHRIRKIDSMSHGELVRQSPHYKRMAAKMGLGKHNALMAKVDAPNSKGLDIKR